MKPGLIGVKEELIANHVCHESRDGGRGVWAALQYG